MELKLRRKFVKFTSGISVITLLLISMLTNYFNYASIISDSNEIMDLLIENNYQLLVDDMQSRRLPLEAAFTTRYFIVVCDFDENIRFIDTKNISAINQEQAVSYTAEVIASGDDTGIIGNYSYKVQETDAGTTYLFLDIETELINFYSFRNYSLLFSVIASIIIFIMSCFLSKRVVSPIIEAYEKQKRFITDVSHEFKTPMAIIKADNDVIELDYGKSEWTESVKAQIRRLNTMIGELINLTRLDEESTELIKTDFSMSDALTEVCDDFSASIIKANLILEENIGKNISYCGEETSIRKLYSLLIENAIKYATENSKIEVNLYKKGNKTVFKLINESENLEIRKYDEWFERFYRAELSRNSETKGHGIGLSIAKAICEKHKAKISAESYDGKKVIISVVF